ncbi:DUF4249 domain-containing protein [uncultured Bacteroides sp.]|jgi:hypothetical lipoprotein|uniref:DUF4249 domain-containing protein n=1 Tax=uncultured Bacteroides sp. TaxID=162156 RepID=UPI00280B01D4|nr:DUF4249 domain-containing protein [uncultured Bacteroides sp.]
MKRTAFLLCFFLSCLSFACCDPEWDFTTDYTPQVVVEGSIESNGFARVYLSYSKALGSTWDSLSVSEIPLTTAKVTVSDGEQTEILTGRSDKYRLPYFVYTGNVLRGVPGKRYTLCITHRGKNITAETSIPAPVGIDSFSICKSENSDTLYQVTAYFHDPEKESNYYKIFTRVYGRDSSYYNAFMGTFSDEILSSPVAKASVYRPFRHTELKKYTPFFTPGEQVGIKFTQVTEEVFQYWNKYENEVVNNSNPFFPNTSNLPGNIQGGIGIWAGYGVSNYRIRIGE